MAATDGSVHIGTKINSTGLTQGFARIIQSFRRTARAMDGSVFTTGLRAGIARIGAAAKIMASTVGKSLLTIAAKGMVVVGIIGKIGAVMFTATAALVGALLVGIMMFSRMFSALRESVSQTSAYRSTVDELQTGFNNLKGAFMGAFGTLLTAALPAIMTVVNWLTKMLNLAAQVIAALSGQATYMRYVEGSAEASAKSAEKQAKALAGFDEINVLQTDKGTTEADAGGPMQFEAAPIGEEAQAAADKIREVWNSVLDWLELAWNKVTTTAKTAWSTIQMIWAIVSTWFMEKVWNPVSKWAVQAWEDIKKVWKDVSTWFQANIWGPLSEKFNWLVGVISENGKQMYDGFIKPLADWFMAYLWPIIQTVINFIGDFIKRLVDNAKTWFGVFAQNFRISFETAVSVIKNIAQMIGGVISGIITIIGGIIQFITGIFTGDWRRAWEGIKNIFKGIFEGLGAIVKGVVNTVIDLINGMIRAIVNGLNAVIGAMNKLQVTVPEWWPVFGGETFGLNIPTVTAPQIPRLATGAVIPPNAEFAAILGDQRSGRNLEAPEGLIRQIIREEVGKLEAEIGINFEGSLGELVRVLKPYIDKESVRIGGNLIQGANP